jgi:hypothetical protein
MNRLKPNNYHLLNAINFCYLKIILKQKQHETLTH